MAGEVLAVGSLAIQDLGLVANGILEGPKLPNWKNHEERLKKDDCLPETGVDIVMVRNDFVPHAFRIRARAVREVADGGLKVFVQVLHHLLKGADLMKEL